MNLANFLQSLITSLNTNQADATWISTILYVAICMSSWGDEFALS
jgi:hypothetical protein